MPLKHDVDIQPALHAWIDEGKSVYLLIDGAESANAVKDRLFKEWGTRYIPIYINTDFASLMEISPLLIIPGDEDIFFEWFLEDGFMQQSGIILVSDVDELSVLRHLQGMLEVYLPNYNLAAFRYYDPIVLNRYVMSVNDTDVTRLLGPLVSMCWPNRLPKQDIHEEWRWEWCEIFQSQESVSNEDAYAVKSQYIIKITENQIENFNWCRYREMASQLAAFGCNSNPFSENYSYQFNNGYSPELSWKLPVSILQDEDAEVTIARQLMHCSTRYGFHSEDEIMHSWNIMRNIEPEGDAFMLSIDEELSKKEVFTSVRISRAYKILSSALHGSRKEVFHMANKIASVAANQKGVKADSNSDV